MSTFTYVPDRNFARNVVPQTYIAQFADGYSQRSSHTINNQQEEFTVSFKNRNESEIAGIVAFFEATKGTDAFTWTPPGEALAIRVIVAKWNKTYITDNYSSLTATFKRVYE